MVQRRLRRGRMTCGAASHLRAPGGRYDVVGARYCPRRGAMVARRPPARERVVQRRGGARPSRPRRARGVRQQRLPFRLGDGALTCNEGAQCRVPRH
jgi:hypothetical protein